MRPVRGYRDRAALAGAAPRTVSVVLGHSCDPQSDLDRGDSRSARNNL